jgi:uncharacterized membrane protein SirB2
MGANWLQAIWRALRLAVLGASGLLLLCTHLLAAAIDEEEKATGGASWVVSYMLVLLCIVLGMICLLHPSGRRERARPEQYGD